MAKREKTSRYEYQKSYQKKYWIGLPKSIRASKRYYQLYIQTKDFTAHDFKILINQKRHSCKEYKKVRDFEEIKRLRTEIKILCGLKEICIIKEQEEHIAGQNVDTPEKRDERKNSPLMDGETGLPWNGWDGKTFINPKRFYFKPLKEPLLCLFESDFKKIVFKSTLGKASPLRNPFTLFDSYRGNKKFARNYKRQERIDYLKWLGKQNKIDPPTIIEIPFIENKLSEIQILHLKETTQKIRERIIKNKIPSFKTIEKPIEDVKIYEIKENKIDILTRWYKPFTANLKTSPYPEFFHQYWNRILSYGFDKEERRQIKLQKLLIKYCKKWGVYKKVRLLNCLPFISVENLKVPIEIDWDGVFSDIATISTDKQELIEYDPIECNADPDSFNDEHDYGLETEIEG